MTTCTSLHFWFIVLHIHGVNQSTTLGLCFKEIFWQLRLNLWGLGYGQLRYQLSTRPGVPIKQNIRTVNSPRFFQVLPGPNLNIVLFYVKHRWTAFLCSWTRYACRSILGVAQTGAMSTKNAQVPLHPWIREWKASCIGQTTFAWMTLP